MQGAQKHWRHTHEMTMETEGGNQRAQDWDQLQAHRIGDGQRDPSGDLPQRSGMVCLPEAIRTC